MEELKEFSENLAEIVMDNNSKKVKSKK